MATKPLVSGIAEERYTPPTTSAIFNTSTTQASVSATAGVAGQRHVLTYCSFELVSNVTTGAFVAGTVGCYVIDGASGGTTYLFKAVAFIGSTGITRVVGENLNVPGSAATALTVEFSGAVTNNMQNVMATYYNIGPSI